MLDGAGHGVVGGDEDEGYAGLETRSSGLGPQAPAALGMAVRYVGLDVCGFGLDVAVLLERLWFWSQQKKARTARCRYLRCTAESCGRAIWDASSARTLELAMSTGR